MRKVDSSFVFFMVLAISLFIMNILYFSTAWAKSTGKKVPDALDSLVTNYSWVYIAGSVALLFYGGIELATNAKKNVITPTVF